MAKKPSRLPPPPPPDGKESRSDLVEKNTLSVDTMDSIQQMPFVATKKESILELGSSNGIDGLNQSQEIALLEKDSVVVVDDEKDDIKLESPVSIVITSDKHLDNKENLDNNDNNAAPVTVTITDSDGNAEIIDDNQTNNFSTQKLPYLKSPLSFFNNLNFDRKLFTSKLLPSSTTHLAIAASSDPQNPILDPANVDFEAYDSLTKIPSPDYITPEERMQSKKYFVNKRYNITEYLYYCDTMYQKELKEINRLRSLKLNGQKLTSAEKRKLKPIFKPLTAKQAAKTLFWNMAEARSSFKYPYNNNHIVSTTNNSSKNKVRKIKDRGTTKTNDDVKSFSNSSSEVDSASSPVENVNDGSRNSGSTTSKGISGVWMRHRLRKFKKKMMDTIVLSDDDDDDHGHSYYYRLWHHSPSKDHATQSSTGNKTANSNIPTGVVSRDVYAETNIKPDNIDPEASKETICNKPSDNNQKLKSNIISNTEDDVEEDVKFKKDEDIKFVDENKPYEVDKNSEAGTNVSNYDDGSNDHIDDAYLADADQERDSEYLRKKRKSKKRIVQSKEKLEPNNDDKPIIDNIKVEIEKVNETEVLNNNSEDIVINKSELPSTDVEVSKHNEESNSVQVSPGKNSKKGHFPHLGYAAAVNSVKNTVDNTMTMLGLGPNSCRAFFNYVGGSKGKKDIFGHSKISTLFDKIFSNVRRSAKYRRMKGVCSPTLLGTTGYLKASVISIIPHIIQYHVEEILKARAEIILATNYWQVSKSSKAIVQALKDLDDNLTLKRAKAKELGLELSEEDKKPVAVKILLDHPTFKTFMRQHNLLSPNDFAIFGIPSDFTNIRVEVQNQHRSPLGTFHAKFLIVDHKVALISSNNIQDRPNLEMMVHLEGGIVDSMYDQFLYSWNCKYKYPLRCLAGPYIEKSVLDDIHIDPETKTAYYGISSEDSNKTQINQSEDITTDSAVLVNQPVTPIPLSTSLKASLEGIDKTSSIQSPLSITPISNRRSLLRGAGANKYLGKSKTEPYSAKSSVTSINKSDIEDKVNENEEESNSENNKYSNKDLVEQTDSIHDPTVEINKYFKYSESKTMALKEVNDINAVLNQAAFTKVDPTIEQDKSKENVPYVYMIEHTKEVGPIPMLLACRKPKAIPGHTSLRTPQNLSWITAMENAKFEIFIQTPTFNASAAIKSILNACRRKVMVHLWVGWGFNDSGEQAPFQGGTNTQVVKRLEKRLELMGRKQYLKVGWYTGRDQIEPIHFKLKARNSHLKFLAVDGHLAMFGSGNMDTQSWFHSQEINIVVDSETIVKEWVECITKNQNTAFFGMIKKEK